MHRGVLQFCMLLILRRAQEIVRMTPNAQLLGMTARTAGVSIKCVFRLILAVSFLQPLFFPLQISNQLGGCEEEEESKCPADGSDEQPVCTDNSCQGQDGKCTTGQYHGCDCEHLECPDPTKGMFLCIWCGGKTEDGKCKGVSCCRTFMKWNIAPILMVTRTQMMIMNLQDVTAKTRLTGTNLHLLRSGLALH